jgi:cytochrome b6-f complex iron-sulfur subunit
MERKTFLKFLTASVASGSLISYLESCKKDSSAPAAPSADFTIDISTSQYSSLQTPGNSTVKDQVIVINNNGNFVALSDICTHEGCSLVYQSNSQHIYCSCHGGTFSLSGSVISGPPPSALKVYNVAKNGTVLHVTG